MSELDDRCLEAFPNWLRSLASDARLLAGVVDDVHAPGEVRVQLAGALNYLLKSVDLIADGIEDLGYMDDAFVLRVAVGTVPGEAVENSEQKSVLQQLASDAALVREFLESDAPRLEQYVIGLKDQAVRGRSARNLVEDEALRQDFVRDLLAWANNYEVPEFSRDQNNLVKLRAFLRTKLPAT